MVRFRSPDRDRAIGSRVHHARRRQGRTQAGLAGMTGMSHSMLVKLERGERHWTLEAVAVVAEALGLPPDYVLGESMVVLEPTVPQEPDPVPAGAGTSARMQELSADMLDLALLDETDRRMIVAMHAVMARRAMRMVA